MMLANVPAFYHFIRANNVLVLKEHNTKYTVDNY